MTRRRKILFGILALPVALYAVYKWHYPTISFNQRMTVEVEVNGEIVSGSGMVRITTVFHPVFLPAVGSSDEHLQGEAAFVEVNGRILFALLRSKSTVSYAYWVARNIFRGNARPRLPLMKPSKELLKMIGEFGTRDISRERYPMLVTFTDIDDPTSVKLVDPNDLAATFGAGVSLKRITLEITNDPLTTGIVEVLGWLPGRKTVTGYLGGWPEDPTGLYLNGSEFKSGGL